MRGIRFEISDPGPNEEEEVVEVRLPRKDVRILQQLIEKVKVAPSAGPGGVVGA